MAEENTNASGIPTNDMEVQIMTDALNEFNKVQGVEVASSTDQPETKVEEKAEQTAEVTEQKPQSDVQPVEKTPEVVGTVVPETKPYYTPEEIELELKTNGDLARLDSSRLSVEGKLIQTSMQRGLTPKLQEAAELRKRFDQVVAEKTAMERQRLQEENERKFKEESELYGEEQAKLLKEVRDYRYEVTQLKQEREIEKQQWAADQQQIAAEKFRQSFIKLAPKYNIPINDEWEDTVLSRVWAENEKRKLLGRQDFISIEDGFKLVSNTVGISNVDSIKKILNANPKAMEALENEWAIKYSQKKDAGATVIKSSGSGGHTSKITDKTDKQDTKITDDPNYDAHADMVKIALQLLDEEQNKI